MIGPLRFNLISLTYGYAGSGSNGWVAKAFYQDGGFVDDNPESGEVSTEGELRTRYFINDGKNVCGAVVAFQAVLNNLETLGIRTYPNASKDVFITNGEDEEMGKQGIPVADIPQEDIAAIKKIAEENGFGVFGIPNTMLD